MLNSNGLLIIFSFLFYCVKPTCELLETQIECIKVAKCEWSAKCTAKSLPNSLRSRRAKSQPEMESESETESESEPGLIPAANAGIQTFPSGVQTLPSGATPQTGYVSSVPGMNNGISITPGGMNINMPGVEHEFESESESESQIPQIGQMPQIGGLQQITQGQAYQQTIPGQVYQQTVPAVQGYQQTIPAYQGYQQTVPASQGYQPLPAYGTGLQTIPAAGQSYQPMPAAAGQMLPGQMEFESESETESETWIPGMPQTAGGVQNYAGAQPGVQYEREVENEVQIGGQTTYSYEHSSNIPGQQGYVKVVNNGAQTLVDTGSGLQPVVPATQGYYADSGVPASFYPDSGLVANPVAPVTPVAVQPAAPVAVATKSPAEKQLQCLALKDPEQCRGMLICEWDARNICIPANVPVAVRPVSIPIVCSSITEMIPCVDADGCQWNIPTQTCKVFRNMVLRKIRTCGGIARESCSEFFGCAWDASAHQCASSKERNSLRGDFPQNELQRTQRLGATGSNLPIDDPYDPYTDSAEPQDQNSQMQCLTKSIRDCARDAQCFWDSREICLPKAMQLETTRAPRHSRNVNNFYHQSGRPNSQVSPSDSKASFFHPTQNSPGAPGLGAGGRNELNGNIAPAVAGIETETETENEAEYPGPYGPNAGAPAQTSGGVNTCFYHPSRDTCLLDTGCFWDRRTQLCASLDVPNFLPATCEGFLFQAPCTLDKRCVWKTGECEEANLDCEDLLFKDKCERSTYNGIPCVWLGGECDEAPIMLRKALSRKSATHNRPEFFAYWPVLIIVPFVFIILALSWKIYSTKQVRQEDLLLHEVFPRVV